MVNKIVEIIEDESLIKKEEYFVIDNFTDIGLKDLYDILLSFKTNYFDKGIIPMLTNKFEIQLFNTFRSYIDLKTYFPKSYVNHTDPRGSFIELIKK